MPSRPPHPSSRTTSTDAPKPRRRFPAHFDHIAPAQKNTAPIATPTVAPIAKPSSAQSVQTRHGIDSQRVRNHMVQRLQTQHGIGNSLVLDAMRSVERHRFVDSALATQAYIETSLPIGFGQTISKPQVVGKMIAALLEKISQPQSATILEIGTGCGYQCAVLSRIFGRVISIERIAGLHQLARRNLDHLHASNIELILGDGMLGHPPAQGRIQGIISAAGGHTPQAWLDQLSNGGRIVAPELNEAHQQCLAVIDKYATHVKRELREAVHFVPLKSGVI